MNLLAFAYDIDSTAYILMAEGRWSEVLRPFTNRVLGPMIARYTGFGTLQIVAGILFAAAVFGLLKRRDVPPCRAWNDVYARELPVFYTHAPLWKMVCPAFLRLGRFTEIGIYEWHPWQALTTVKVLALSFGALIPYAILNWRTLNPRRFDGWLELAFWSGLAYWILTPICGFSPNRYIGYAWPLVWFAVLPSLTEKRRRTYLIWLLAHLAVIGVCL